MSLRMGDLVRSELPREPGCGGAARRLVERFLRERRLEALADDARIIVSELVNNAYLHGRGRIELTVRLIDRGPGSVGRRSGQRERRHQCGDENLLLHR